VFQLRTRMSFREKVGDFLELERALERDRVIELAGEEKHSTSIDIFLCDRFNLVAQL